MEAYPNSRNIIAGRTVFTVDIRSPEKEVLDEMDQRISHGHRHDLARRSTFPFGSNRSALSTR